MEPLSDNDEINLDRLVVESLSKGCIWGLKDDAGNWAAVPSEQNSEIDVIPFWSSRELAISLCTEDWGIYTPTAIDMEEFLDDWLPGMHNDVLLVGINWNDELEGAEMEPLDLLEEFEAELS